MSVEDSPAPVILTQPDSSALAKSDFPLENFHRVRIIESGSRDELKGCNMKKSIGLSAVSLTLIGQGLSAQTVQNYDALLNNGSSVSLTYHALDASWGTQVRAKRNSNEVLWFMGADPWGITQGSGQIDMSYGGNGTAQWSVNLTNLNYTGVNAFPFLGFGGDVFGYHNGNQGLPFSVALPKLRSLTTEVSYTLEGQISSNVDVLFDLWLAPTATYSGGTSGAVEVEILPYISYSDRSWATYKKTISLPCTLDGQPTNLSFLEYAAGNQTGAGTTILFFPASGFGLASADLQFDAAVLLKEAAATAGVEDWYLPGYNIGTEFGLSSSADFDFTLNKFRVVSEVPEPGTLSLVAVGVGLAVLRRQPRPKQVM